ncbi:MAG: GNAT family N-acetyltransferase [Clostridiales bacterium]|nr:GNAT family N-acetyltransferase [Clostridiales bacterium]
MQIRIIKKEEYPQAFELVFRVFDKFEAPEYSQEGIDSFKKSLSDEKYISQLEIYAAFENEKIIGVIATRNSGNHIALFFVDEEYQRQGIGKKLFQLAIADNYTGTVTVNSSPYAVKIYEKLGFEKVSEEKVDDGIRYTPMFYKVN